MSAKLGKFAPIVAVAGVLGYFCWPYLDEPTAASNSKGSTKAIEMSAALLSPPTAPDLDRDPFAIPDAGKSSASATLDRAAEATPGAKAAGRSAASRHASGPDTFVLNGTYIRGDHRMAVINGSAYAEGEQIAPSGPGAICSTVARVEFDRVVLKLDGQTTEVSYSTGASKPAAHSKATPAAMGVADAAREKHSPAREGEVRTGSRSAGTGPDPHSLRTQAPSGSPHSVGASPAGAANDIPGKAN